MACAGAQSLAARQNIIVYGSVRLSEEDMPTQQSIFRKPYPAETLIPGLVTMSA
jgi:hypothetical protein